MGSGPFAATDKIVPIDARQRELAERVAKVAPGNGVHKTAFAPLSLIRASDIGLPLPSVYAPSLCVVVQGRKRALVGGESYSYDAFNYLFVSVCMPVLGQILEASPERPYLCARIDIDLREVARLQLEMEPAPRTGEHTERPLFVARLSPDLLEAMLRLVRLLDAPADLAVLGPLTLREIWYRLLRGEMGQRLRDLTEAEGPVQRISRAIELLQQRFHKTLRVEDLAESAHMSPSTFHVRFKAVTTMSPLQFQKQLRLHEARRLMMSDGLEAAVAGYRVGYESPSQFSREYHRLFGAPPRREIAAQRRAPAAGTVSR